MRFLIQRVSRASVTVAGEVNGAIKQGLVVLIGIGTYDTHVEARSMVTKLINLRVFPDSDGRMNRSIVDVSGGLLLISQFTLYGDCRKGRRPSFEKAGDPETARALYEFVVQCARDTGLLVETGVFREHMEVELVNDGPVTLMLDSADLFAAK